MKTLIDATRLRPSQIAGTLDTVRVFNVDYVHIRFDDGDELFVTEYGTPFLGQLLPSSFWTDRAWFEGHSKNLFGGNVGGGGTGCLYRIQTKPFQGRSKEIVLKWNRMGEDIPGGHDSHELDTAKFNSPFEEFSLVFEMRNATEGSRRRILTHKPLAIYVPSDRIDLWRLGRRDYMMQQVVKAHADIELDIHRQYAVVYEWIDGIDAVEAHVEGALTEAQMGQLTLDVEADMRSKGFQVLDRKPRHVIVRVDKQGKVVRDRGGRIVRAAVDFELLVRTPEREERVRRRKRQKYLWRQVHRFDHVAEGGLPPHLSLFRILGVDYIYGPAESTNGALWVVGRDTSLFDYFLPERWRGTPRTELPVVRDAYDTITKDDIHLVWKISRVGQCATGRMNETEDMRARDHGYNSPFEEVAVSVELSRRGIPATYPRAIYMTGHESAPPDGRLDVSRYDTHRWLTTPDGSPILRQDREYIVIWGYWNKPDEMLAVRDGDYYRNQNALDALRRGILDKSCYQEMHRKLEERLAAIGMSNLDFRGGDLLIAIDSSGEIVRDRDGLPEARICSFELLNRHDVLGPALGESRRRSGAGRRPSRREEGVGYSEDVWEECRHPQNVGPLTAPDARGRLTGPCGDTMELHLRIEGRRIREAAFTTDGCDATVACGSKLTGLITGMDVDQASRVTPTDVELALGGLSLGDQHCAVLAVSTLASALIGSGTVAADGSARDG